MSGAPTQRPPPPRPGPRNPVACARLPNSGVQDLTMCLRVAARGEYLFDDLPHALVFESPAGPGLKLCGTCAASIRERARRQAEENAK